MYDFKPGFFLLGCFHLLIYKIIVNKIPVLFGLPATEKSYTYIVFYIPFFFICFSRWHQIMIKIFISLWKVHVILSENVIYNYFKNLTLLVFKKRITQKFQYLITVRLKSNSKFKIKTETTRDLNMVEAMMV